MLTGSTSQVPKWKNWSRYEKQGSEDYGSWKVLAPSKVDGCCPVSARVIIKKFNPVGLCLSKIQKKLEI